MPVGCERSQEARHFPYLLVMTPQTTIVNDQIVQVKAMDLSACNLAGKLGRFKDVAEENSTLCIYSSAESVID